MTKQKKMLIRILAAFAAFVLGYVLPFEGVLKLSVFLVSYAVIGYDILWKAVRGIFKGQVFDENFLMALATVGAFFVGEYPEGVAVMLFYQVGELFQSYAVNQSRKSIASLMDICPEYANVLRQGKIEIVDPEEVSVDEWILIKPGEKIPLDGIVTDGTSTLDTSALTGESIPRTVLTGDSVISGCINLNGTLTVQVTKEYDDCTVTKILELVENASSRKANAENFITKFARYYTPAVVIAALLLAFLPPIFIQGESLSAWIYRALIFLVVSCPCALVISIPLGFFGGIGAASKQGVLIKGSNYLELLAETQLVVFDKTGTLTKGNFVVTKIEPVSMSAEELLELTAKVESYSNHPISNSICAAYEKQTGTKINAEKISIEEIAGHGIHAIIDGKQVYVGNEKLMKEFKIPYQKTDEVGTVVYTAVDKTFAGSIVISDQIKPDSAIAISGLKTAGVKKTVMLTGDADVVGQKVAKELSLDEAYTELLPADKVEKMEELLKEKSEKGKLAFVGDGINDAPVLARADIGIAMGGLGSDAAIEAADVVIMTDEPSKIVTAMEIAKRTLRIVKQNIVFALLVKAVVLILGAIGLSNMWEAVFADVGVSVIAIINSIRVLRTKPTIKKK